MDNFFSFYVLGIPGVLTYLMYKFLEDAASTERSNIEMLAITSILWIPTVVLSITFFNLTYFLVESDLTFISPNILESLGIIKIKTIDSLIFNINSFVFIMLFTLTTVVSSILVSLLFPKMFEIIIKLINVVRKRKGYAELASKATSPWGLFFIVNKEYQKNPENGEHPIVVQISYLDDPNHFIYGSLKIISSDGKKLKSFVIEEEEMWTDYVENYKQKIDENLPFAEVFFDATDKLVIRELNQQILREKMEEWKSDKKGSKQIRQNQQN